MHVSRSAELMFHEMWGGGSKGRSPQEAGGSGGAASRCCKGFVGAQSPGIAIVHACTVAIVHARTVAIVHARTIAIVHVCTVALVHVHACAVAIV